jgi:Arc/MetJ-type ribon-helix-helix transcriptional regulator
MTIHLSKDQERFVHDAVRAGLYISEDAVVNDALDRLRQTMPKPAKAPGKGATRAKAAAQAPNSPPSIKELHRKMMARGLIIRLPDPSLDIDDDDPDDQPVPIKGEPLSETIIRERR